MLFLDFLVQPKGKEDRGEENGGHHKAQKNGRRGAEALVDLRRPHKRHAPENHGDDACKMH